MLVLVTGGTGYLGGHIVEALRRRGHEVRSLVRDAAHTAWFEARGVERVQGDLRDYASLRRACHGVAGVVHAAAIVGHWSGIDAEQRAVNVEGTSQLLRAAGRARVGRIVHVSSIVAVGCTRDRRPVDETEAWTGLDQPNIHYVRTKRESEERAFAAARGGLPVSIVAPTAMIGPRAQDGRPCGHTRAALAEARARVIPGGSSVAHVADVADGVVSALERARPNERTILGGHNLSWTELRAGLARTAGLEARVTTRPLLLRTPLVAVARSVELLGISRPRFAPDRYRLWGWYSYAKSDKAQKTLDYRIPPLEEVLVRALPVTL